MLIHIVMDQDPLVVLLCQAVSEVLDTISTENNIIIGDFNVNWLVEADRQPL